MRRLSIAVAVMMVPFVAEAQQAQDPAQILGQVLNRVSNDMNSSSIAGQNLASDDATIRQAWPAVIQEITQARQAVADKDKKISDLQKKVDELNAKLAEGAKMCLQSPHGPMSEPRP